LTYFAIVITGICGFLGGILWQEKAQSVKKECAKHIAKHKKNTSASLLTTEYKNFLNYDGSEQA
jgi:hypothetical protein